MSSSSAGCPRVSPGWPEGYKSRSRDERDDTRRGRALPAAHHERPQERASRILDVCVEPGSTVSSDGWATQAAATGISPRPPPGPEVARRENTIDPLAGRPSHLTRVALAWAAQGSVGRDHLVFYLDEFSFRLKRRVPGTARCLRLMESCLGLRDDLPQITTNYNHVKTNHPTPPATKGRTESLERPASHRPWREP